MRLTVFLSLLNSAFLNFNQSITMSKINPIVLSDIESISEDETISDEGSSELFNEQV